MNKNADILNKIVTQKKEELRIAKSKISISQLLDTAPRDKRKVHESLKTCTHAAVIAEIKPASPSKGRLRSQVSVEAIAKAYEKNHARCLSILTDETFFQGHANNLKIARESTNLPVLRKDFIIDSYQIYESYHMQADCILLIAAILDDHQLQDYHQLAHELGLEVLIESHDQAELERALQVDTPLIGINNRNLKSFHTDINRSIELLKLIPEDKLVISESGIHTHQDIQYMQAQGIHCFLIGESLMIAEHPGEQLKQLIFG